MKAGVLICHGAADPFVPAEQVDACLAALDGGGADYTFLALAGAKHGFTNPGADARGMGGLAYSPTADARSWAAMTGMFDQLLKGEPATTYKPE